LLGTFKQRQKSMASHSMAPHCQESRVMRCMAAQFTAEHNIARMAYQPGAPHRHA
jgi:hypothetical protein